MTPRAALRAAMLSGLLVSAAGGAGVAAAGRGDPALRDLGADIAAREARLAEARAGLRAAFRERRAAEARLREGGAATFDALAALDRIGRAPPLAFFAHPAGPKGAARAAMIVAAATPGLEAEVAARRDLGEIGVAEARGAAAAERLRDALGALQSARVALEERLSAPERSKLLRDAREAGREQPEDALAIEALLSLSGASGDADAGSVEGPTAPVVTGRVARGYAQTGLWVEVSAPAWALVRAPVLSTLRHVGDLRGRGLTAVLEPRAGELIALSGLGSVDRAVGEVLAAGEPLGAMGGPPPAADEFLIDASSATGTIPRQTLYIEARSEGAAVDPERWFPAAAPGGPDEKGMGLDPAAGGTAGKRTDG